MIILDKTINNSQLKQIASETFGDLVKGVVDIRREIVALSAELHSDLEALLLENGSKQIDVWGINLYPDVQGEDFLEFDSMINVRPSQGNRSRGVEDKAMQEKIRHIVYKWVKR